MRNGQAYDIKEMSSHRRPQTDGRHGGGIADEGLPATCWTSAEEAAAAGLRGSGVQSTDLLAAEQKHGLTAADVASPGLSKGGHGGTQEA